MLLSKLDRSGGGGGGGKERDDDPPGVTLQSRPEPNMLFFLPIMLFGNAQFFYRLCSKLCPIMPVNFARESI